MLLIVFGPKGRRGRGGGVIHHQLSDGLTFVSSHFANELYFVIRHFFCAMCSFTNHGCICIAPCAQSLSLHAALSSTRYHGLARAAVKVTIDATPEAATLDAIDEHHGDGHTTVALASYHDVDTAPT
jgi:hypothetical protein